MSRDLIMPPPIFRWHGGPRDGDERTLREFTDSWVVPIIEGDEVNAGALIGHAGSVLARTPGVTYEHVYMIRRDHMSIPDTFRGYHFDYVGQRPVDDRVPR